MRPCRDIFFPPAEPLGRRQTFTFSHKIRHRRNRFFCDARKDTFLKFLFIEPFAVGSHLLFAQGLAAHSRHDIRIISLPGENFRWRMLGAAIYLADAIENLDCYDGVIVTDLFNLADFKALTCGKCPPVLVYFHENQLTYPQPAKDRSIRLLSMINISTALAADQVVFNSEFHQGVFLAAVPEFLSRAKDCRPVGVAERIRDKSSILYPGIDLSPEIEPDFSLRPDSPLIIWNHRWGFDKNPKLFFQALEEIDRQGLDFRLAVTGENFGMIPDGFARAKEIFKDRIVAFGYVPSRADYLKLLREGDIVISTAIQENFGMSVIEAMILGCLPLLPNRLAYPEILPEEFHAHCLYKNRHDLREKLVRILAGSHPFDETRKTIAQKMTSFLWENVIDAYDDVLEELGNRRGD